MATAPLLLKRSGHVNANRFESSGFIRNHLPNSHRHFTNEGQEIGHAMRRGDDEKNNVTKATDQEVMNDGRNHVDEKIRIVWNDDCRGNHH
jgi:hypothetical protein